MPTPSVYASLKRDTAKKLREVHSALDRALGDTDVTHIEDENELRETYPVQWAAEQIAGLIQFLEE